MTETKYTYTRLPNTSFCGSVVNNHQYERNGTKIVVRYDNGNDFNVFFTINGLPWGWLKLTDSLFNKVDFGSEDKDPVGLEEALDYIYTHKD